MNLLVTGGAGYVGSHFTWALSDRGKHCVVIDNLSNGCEARLPARAQLYTGDISDSSLVQEIVGKHEIDVIVHFAGISASGSAANDPLGSYEGNTVKTMQLIGAAAAAGVGNFIYSSSALVYGTPLTAGPIREDAILNPASPYGASKLMSEIVLRDAAAAYGMRYVILRYFTAVGADPKRRTGQSCTVASDKISSACRAALDQTTMKICGTNHEMTGQPCIREYLHVSDVASAHGSAVEYLRCGGSSLTVNCGYNRGFTDREVVAAVERACGTELRVEVVPCRGEAPVLTTNSRRIGDRLDWAPRFDSLDQMVSTAIAWEWPLLSRRNIASKATFRSQENAW